MAKKLLTTPKGVAVYPHLSKPDTKFDDAGVYTIKLKLTGKDAASLVKTIDAAIQASGLAAKAEDKYKGKKIKKATPPYKQTDDGATEFTFKMKASGVSKKTKETWTRKPVIFNASGQPDNTMRIGGGSIVRVSYELNQYTKPSTENPGTVLAGANLRLEAVQVIELVEFGGNAEYFGFESEGEEEGAPATAAAKVAEDEDEEPAAGSADEF